MGRKTPDFFIEHRGQKIVLEIGGKGKSRSQFKGVQADRKIILTPLIDGDLSTNTGFGQSPWIIR